jgi:hypothetical protein
MKLSHLKILWTSSDGHRCELTYLHSHVSVFLTDYRRDYERDPTLPGLVKLRPFFRRALFTVGLLLRHFDFTDRDVIQGLEVSVLGA